MRSSSRCSARRRPALAGTVAALLAALLAGCAHRAPAVPPAIAQAAPGGRPRVLLLPVDNLSATAAPTKELLAALAAAFGDRLDLVTGDALEPFLAKHRLRHTGGIDAAAARAARDELRADGVLLSTLELYRAGFPPMLGLTVRLVSTGDEPVILWMDAAAWSGDQEPGLLSLGIVDRVEEVRARVVRDLAASLARFLDGAPEEARCASSGRYRPRMRFRLDSADDLAEEGLRRSVAVVPFVNHSKRRGAGEALSLEFVRQLVGSGRYRVIEPGVVRDYLLRGRVIMPGGVSLETTRLLVGRLGAELVVSGTVLDFDESAGSQGPTVRFSATMLHGGSGDVVWDSRSANRGDDGVYFFGLGRVRTAPDLTCRMVAATMFELSRPGETRVAWPARRWDGAPGRLTHDRMDRRPAVKQPANVAGVGAPAEPHAGKAPGET